MICQLEPKPKEIEVDYLNRNRFPNLQVSLPMLEEEEKELHRTFTRIKDQYYDTRTDEIEALDEIGALVDTLITLPLHLVRNEIVRTLKEEKRATEWGWLEQSNPNSCIVARYVQRPSYRVSWNFRELSVNGNVIRSGWKFMLKGGWKLSVVAWFFDKGIFNRDFQEGVILRR